MWDQCPINRGPMSDFPHDAGVLAWRCKEANQDSSPSVNARGSGGT